MWRDCRYNAVRVLVAAPEKIIEMGGSFCKRASGTAIKDPGGRRWRATAHFNR
jgi:hypothetical protein